jgi:ribosomal protein S18 acetylase RimI-like enzyme
MDVEIRELCESDREWVGQFLCEHWGGSIVVSRGRLHQAEYLPGFLAIRNGVPVGLLTFHIDEDQLEVVTLDSMEEHQGIGTALLVAARGAAGMARCRRLWLITTNDNVPAIEFYKRRGLVITAVHHDALDISRKLKPQIPERGLGGIPIRDEIELELTIDPANI